MKAIEAYRVGPIESGPLREVERPDPHPAADEIRVRVRVCGVCRTDLHVIEGDLPTRKRPIIPGHQVVGIVDALGSSAARFRLGDRVGVAWLCSTCGACEYCRIGAENLCPHSAYTGYDQDGGYAELAVVKEAFAYAIPPALSDEDVAPLLCAGIIGYRAFVRSRVPNGGRLGLYGFGSSAHITMQLALSRGCEVFVATRGESHRRFARELGAAWVGEAHDAPPAKLDGAILFAPAGELVPSALRALRPGGTVALAGIHLSPIPEMTYEPHLFHEKTLTSVEANTRADGEALLSEAARIPICPRTTTFALSNATEALVRLKTDRIDGTAILVV